jgi:hypothetical protein
MFRRAALQRNDARPDALLRACLPQLAAGALILLTASVGYAQGAAEAARSPFNGLNGSWVGDGLVQLAGGSKEPIRCRADYTVDVGRDNLKQTLRCASDSYKFQLRSDVSHNNGAITGRWEESSRNQAGNISGRARNDQIDARIESASFAALITVRTRGNRQTVHMSSPGSEVSQVTITMRRR